MVRKSLFFGQIELSRINRHKLYTMILRDFNGYLLRVATMTHPIEPKRPYTRAFLKRCIIAWRSATPSLMGGPNLFCLHFWQRVFGHSLVPALQTTKLEPNLVPSLHLDVHGQAVLGARLDRTESYLSFHSTSIVSIYHPPPRTFRSLSPPNLQPCSILVHPTKKPTRNSNRQGGRT